MKAIYTAIIGPYDTLKEPSIITPGWDYICYTDQRFNNKTIWDIRTIPKGDVRKARELKILTPLEHDLTIWIDGSMKVNCNLDQFISEYSQGDLTIMKHPHRKCIYEEAEACIRLRKDNPIVINDQMKRYKEGGLVKNTGLAATGVIIRKNTSLINKLMLNWWEEVKIGSIRDQLSFNYIVKNPYYMPFSILKKEFLLNKHYK